MILFAGGDVGGARALLPVIAECERQELDFAVVSHGHLLRELQSTWRQIALPDELTADRASIWLTRLDLSVLIFSSSVHDTVALTLARQAKKMGIAVVHLLDNWSNYRLRLEHDHLPMLVPDFYMVMDELAYDGALAEGIPADVLQITGQPALAGLSDELANFTKASRSEGPIGLVFVSEPVLADQGDDPESPVFRGYTEQTVLRLLCRELQRYADQVSLSILPHPREDRRALEACWREVQGKVPGTIFTGNDGLHHVLTADGVVGMASILLYEAWLVGIPVLSLQPGVRGQALRTLERRAGLFFVDSSEKTDKTLSVWLTAVQSGERIVQPDLARHKDAAAQICTLITGLMTENGVFNKRMEAKKA